MTYTNLWPALALVLAGTAAPAQETVTDDQGRSEVIYEIGQFYRAPGAQITYDFCTACHSELIIIQQGQDRDGWDEILVWMVEDMGMGELFEEDRDQILDYLAAYYGEDRPNYPPAN